MTSSQFDISVISSLFFPLLASFSDRHPLPRDSFWRLPCLLNKFSRDEDLLAHNFRSSPGLGVYCPNWASCPVLHQPTLLGKEDGPGGDKVCPSHLSPDAHPLQTL